MEQKEYGFFDYFNSFERWCEEDNPTDKAVVLYIKFLCMFNRRGWQRWAGIDTQRLMLMANTTNMKTAYRARDALVQAGLLEYQPRRKGKVSEYRLLIRGANNAKCFCEFVRENDRESDRETEKERERIFTRPRLKNNPPLPPRGERERDAQQQRFDEQIPLGTQAARWNRNTFF